MLVIISSYCVDIAFFTVSLHHQNEGPSRFPSGLEKSLGRKGWISWYLLSFVEYWHSPHHQSIYSDGLGNTSLWEKRYFPAEDERILFQIHRCPRQGWVKMVVVVVCIWAQDQDLVFATITSSICIVTTTCGKYHQLLLHVEIPLYVSVINPHCQWLSSSKWK